MVLSPSSELGALEAILDGVPTPLLLVEPGSARMRFANRAAHRWGGGALPLADDAGEYPARFELVDEAGRRLTADEFPAVRAARGQQVVNEMVDWRRPDGLRTVLVNSGTVETSQGRLVVLAFEDVTAIEAERRRSRALADATAALASARGFDETLQTVAASVVPRLADWCFVELLQPDGSIVRRVIRGADPAKHAAALEYDRRFPLDPDAPIGSPAVIRTGEPELTPEIPPEWIDLAAHGDEEYRRVLLELNFRSAMVVPLRAGGRVIGDLALAQSDSGRRFGPEDLAAAQELADRCALFLDNTRLTAELRAVGVAERAAREELSAILEGVADAVVAQGADGRIVFANAAAVELCGYDSAEALRAAPLEVVRERFGFRTAEGEEVPGHALPGRRALAGEQPEPLTVRYRPPAGEGERWARLKARPLRSQSGGVRLAITVIEDITEIKQAEQAQRFLAEASRVLAGSLDYERTLVRVAELAVPAIADWCAVDLAGSDGIERVAARHVDPAKVELAEELARRYPPDPEAEQGVPAVLRTGAAQHWPRIPPELLEAVARDDEHLALLRSLGFVSAMVVPMRVRDEVLGAITLVSAESGRVFDADDLALAEDLGLRAATAIQNARLYSQRSAIAHTLQTSLLPPELPEIDQLECAALFHAAGAAHDVGGDFYDVFSTDEDEWFAVIGDVCGKGAEAAATTALVRYTVRAAAVRRRSPAAILRWLNDAMLRHENAPSRFCTIAVARLDAHGEGGVHLTAASGGHPLPRVARAAGGVERLGAPGTLVGVTEDFVVVEDSTVLAPGDALMLFTDGLTEAGAPRRLWSPDDVDTALEQARAAAGGSVQRLVEQLAAAALGDVDADPRDDVALLALRAR